jgi:hypothetical protein
MRGKPELFNQKSISHGWNTDGTRIKKENRSRGGAEEEDEKILNSDRINEINRIRVAL